MSEPLADHELETVCPPYFGDHSVHNHEWCSRQGCDLRWSDHPVIEGGLLGCPCCGMSCCILTADMNQCSGAYEGVCHKVWERAYGTRPWESEAKRRNTDAELTALRARVAALTQVLEFYALEESYEDNLQVVESSNSRLAPICYDSPNVMEDRGYLARTALKAAAAPHAAPAVDVES